MADERIEVAVAWWAAKFQVEDRREAFTAALRSLLERDLERGGFVTLKVDYDPWDTMLEAVHAAGIECRGFCNSAEGLLPYKTVMQIDDDKVIVSWGYAAPYETLWAREG